MNQTPRKPRRSAARAADAIARKNAADAVQRALDRRDNGGATGH